MLKKLIIFVLTVSICFVSVLFPSCKKQQKEGDIVARMQGATLTWDAYEGAASYSVRCALADGSGYSITVKETSYLSPYTVPGDYAYTVSAQDKDGKTIAKSGTVVYHLGTGEAADVVSIGSADDFMGITNSYTISFGKTNVSAPIYYRLTEDIDFTGKSFTPIGTSSKPFYGVLDGAGHKITGLSFTKCNTDGNVGLFGYIKNAIIKNLTIEGASLTFDKNSEVTKGELNCGFLVGYATSSLIDNCHVTGSVNILPNVITVDNYTLSAGGIIGKMTSGRVSGVSFDGDIRAQYGRVYAGGIVGFANGTDPDFMLLNAASKANVTAVSTSYNASTDASYAISRAGIVIGNLSHAGRIASIVATGTASATSTVDGTPTSDLTSGVFGRAKSDTNALTVPVLYLYYDASIQKAVGNVSNHGSFANYIFPLTEEQMKSRESYSIGADPNGVEKYGLNFDDYWTIPEGGIPSLKRVATVSEQPALELTIASEVPEHEFSYRMNLEDAFTPTYFDLKLNETLRGVGYYLNTILKGIGAEVTSLYSDDQIVEGVKIKFSAEGKDDLVITVKKDAVPCYLVYGEHSVFEAPALSYGGFKLVASLETYDYTDTNKITITFLAPSAEA